MKATSIGLLLKPQNERSSIVEVMAYIIEPFLLLMEVTTGEELEALRNQAGVEMRLDSFCGKMFLKSVWAERG